MEGNEKLRNPSTRDVMKDLNKLGEEIAQKNNETVKQNQYRATLIRLYHQYNELQKKRRLLKEELSEFLLRPVVYEKTKSSEWKSKNAESELNSAKARKRFLEDLLQLYSLTGVSVIEIDNCRILLRYDVYYESRHSSRFFTELAVSSKDISLLHHNLPAFVPVQKLAADHLCSNNIKEFSGAVYSFLFVYVQRKGELEKVQLNFEHKIFSGIESTLAKDYIHFVLQHRICLIDITLHFFNLMELGPTKIAVVCQDADGNTNTNLDEIRSVCVNLLTKHPLSVAVWRILNFMPQEQSSS